LNLAPFPSAGPTTSNPEVIATPKKEIQMKSRVLIAIVISLTFSFAQPATHSSQEPAPKQYFIAIFSRGPAWDDSKPANEQVGFKEHGENLRRLRTEKRIPIGGRYGEKGMVIIEAKNEDEARSLFASDVMVLKKTFALELHQFRPFYKGTIE
jgi:hypothetical protein